MNKAILISLLFLIPFILFANTGSVLLLFTIFHALAGNLIIGVIESLIITRILKIKAKLHVFIVLIFANYFSMFIGFSLSSYISEIFKVDIYNIITFLYTILFLSFIITIIAESGFYLYLFRKNKINFKKGVVAIFVANITTYLIMAILYILFSDLSLITEYKFVNSDYSKKLNKYELYFMPKGKKTFYKYNKGSIKEVNNINLQKKLKKEKDIMLNPPYINSEIKTFVKNYDNWNISLYGMFLNGISYSRKNERNIHYAGLETPYITFFLKFPVYIGNNLLLFELNNEIFILNLKKKEISLLLKGNIPIIGIK